MYRLQLQTQIALLLHLAPCLLVTERERCLLLEILSNIPRIWFTIGTSPGAYTRTALLCYPFLGFSSTLLCTTTGRASTDSTSSIRVLFLPQGWAGWWIWRPVERARGRSVGEIHTEYMATEHVFTDYGVTRRGRL